MDIMLTCMTVDVAQHRGSDVDSEYIVAGDR
jgi:hypothetical protein